MRSAWLPSLTPMSTEFMALLWLRRPCTTSSRDTCAVGGKGCGEITEQEGQPGGPAAPTAQPQATLLGVATHVGHTLGGGRPPQKHNGCSSCGAGAYRKGKEGKTGGNEEVVHLVGCLQLLTVEGQIEVGDGLFPPELDGRQVIRQRSGRLAVIPSQVHLLARLPDVALVPAGTGPAQVGRVGSAPGPGRQPASQHGTVRRPLLLARPCAPPCTYLFVRQWWVTPLKRLAARLLLTGFLSEPSASLRRGEKSEVQRPAGARRPAGGHSAAAAAGRCRGSPHARHAFPRQVYMFGDARGAAHELTACPGASPARQRVKR